MNLPDTQQPDPSGRHVGAPLGGHHATSDQHARSQGDVGRNYETRDVKLSVVGWLAATIAGVIALSIAGLYLLMQRYEMRAERRDPRLSPLAETRPEPPAPRLQSEPIVDYQEYQARQRKLLDSYGWADREKGQVRIPVSRAMEIALERGLPEPAAPAQDAPPASEDAARENQGAPATRGDAAPPKAQVPPQDAAPQQPAAPQEPAPSPEAAAPNESSPNGDTEK